MSDIERLQKELEHYKKLYGVGDIATRAYATAIKILEQLDRDWETIFITY